MELQLEHPQESEFTIDRQGKKLGIVLAASKASASICVKKLDPEGAMHMMNKADCRQHLKPHDRIVKVNGRDSDRAAMARALAEEVVTMTVCSYYLPGVVYRT